ncbi:MAG: DUF3999 family protein, partial [Kiritimatiellaeota bacterium]|nr:DUF3999 family protein [Kiritimatiellota bacterium]
MKHCLLLWTLLAPAVALTAPAPAAFRWSRPLEGPAPTSTTVAAVPLDDGLYAATADDYRDLRLVNETGTELPRALEQQVVVRQHTVRRAVASRLLALTERPDNSVAAEFALTDTNAVAVGFSVRTPLRDFQHGVQVEGRADGADWTTLVAEAPLFDYTRYMDLRQLEVALPANTCRRFRLTISNVTAEKTQPWTRLMQQTGGHDGRIETRTVDLQRQPFRVDSVSFWRLETVDGAVEAARADGPLKNFSVARDAQERATIVTLDAGRRPLNRLALDIAESNFSRPVMLQLPVVRNGVEGWVDASSGRLLHIALPGYARRELALDFPEQRLGRARLVLRDGDNPPLTVRGVSGSGPVYRLLFLAEPGHHYGLRYGAADCAVPSYDLDSVLAPARRGLQPAVWQLGTPVENTDYHSASTSRWAWLNSAWAFGGALV